MHIALFGGAFDPPHNGHKLVASTLIEKNIVDQVWFVPVFEHPWAKQLGKTFMSDYSHRLHMIKLLCTSDALQTREYRGVSYTFDTLEYFSQKYPMHHFSWVMGSEYLPKFDAFLSMHPGLAEYRIYMYPRAGHAMKGLRKNMVGLHDVGEIDVSSTQVRNLASKGESISNMVPSAIEAYITKHALYATTAQPKV
jgi:nicotinate-nucleotide adenylyltransferase